jgi:hypothetical protein
LIEALAAEERRIGEPRAQPRTQSGLEDASKRELTGECTGDRAVPVLQPITSMNCFIALLTVRIQRLST